MLLFVLHAAVCKFSQQTLLKVSHPVFCHVVNISQGSGAKYLRCGGIFNDQLTAVSAGKGISKT